MASLPGYPEVYLNGRGESPSVSDSVGSKYQPGRKKGGKIVRTSWKRLCTPSVATPGVVDCSLQAS